MKATGVVRRMDNLGRIVIPKEIRRTLRIREGDPLEIFTGTEGEIIFKKYSPIGDISEFAKNYTDSLSKTTGNTVCITDKDVVVSVAGQGKKSLESKNISKELCEAIERRETIVANAGDKRYISITDGNDEFSSEIISTIICEGDAIGAVIILSKAPHVVDDVNLKLASSAAVMLGKHMEN